MASRPFRYSPDHPARDGVLTVLCDYIRARGKEGRESWITVGDAKRSLEQNARMWALLTDVSKQVQWPVNGKLKTLPPEDWKTIFTAALSSESRVAQGLDGGFVLLGSRTSKMSKRELSDLMTVIESFGAQHDVKWSDESQC